MQWYLHDPGPQYRISFRNCRVHRGDIGSGEILKFSDVKVIETEGVSNEINGTDRSSIKLINIDVRASAEGIFLSSVGTKPDVLDSTKVNGSKGWRPITNADWCKVNTRTTALYGGDLTAETVSESEWWWLTSFYFDGTGMADQSEFQT